MPPGGSRLSLEDTCEFKIPNYDIRERDAYLLLAKECATNFGRNSFECLQPVTPGTFHITFRSVAQAKDACFKGLLFRNERFPVTSVADNTTVVTVKRAPFRMGDNAIASALLPYGDVKGVSHVMFNDEEIGEFANGDRRVNIIMKTAIPNFIRIGSYTLMLTYRGVTRACRKCLSADHLASECNAVLECDSCGRRGHVAALCGHSDSGRDQEGPATDSTAPKTFADIVRASEHADTNEERRSGPFNVPPPSNRSSDAPFVSTEYSQQPKDVDTTQVQSLPTLEDLVKSSGPSGLGGGRKGKPSNVPLPLDHSSGSPSSPVRYSQQRQEKDIRDPVDFPAFPYIEGHHRSHSDTVASISSDLALEEFCDTVETPVSPLSPGSPCGPTVQPVIVPPKFALPSPKITTTNVKYNKKNEKRPVNLSSDQEENSSTDGSRSSPAKQRKDKKRSKKEKSYTTKRDFLKEVSSDQKNV